MSSRELDAKVAEKVMEITLEQHTGRGGDEASARACIPAYSTDIAASFLVVEKMRERGWSIAISTRADYWIVSVLTVDRQWTHMDISLPLTIITAALGAVEGEGLRAMRYNSARLL